MRKYDDAIAAYREGIDLEDTPALQKGLKEVEEAKRLDQTDPSDVYPLQKMFNDPNMISKIAANPKTSRHLADPKFIQTVR